MKKSATFAVCTGITVFACIFFTRYFIVRLVPGISAVQRQVMLEVLLGAGSVAVAIKVFGIPPGWFSIGKGFIRKIAFRYSLRALLLGMLATAVIITFRMPAIPLMKQMRPAQMLLVLLLASVSEELLCRGLVQGLVKDDTAAGNSLAAVLAGAIVFSLIHATIYLTGGSGITCITIMTSAFILGILAGRARRQSNLGAAKLTHIAFNVGGFAGGILINIVSMIATGHLVNT